MPIIYHEDVDFNKLEKPMQDLATLISKVLKSDTVCTSGFRTWAEEKVLTGSPTSSHMRGLAIDLYAPDSTSRYEIIFACMAAGAKRIGIGTRHIHVDCDKAKVMNLVWLEA